MVKLLSGNFMQTLEELAFRSKRVFYGGMQGNNRSRKYGHSVEFADYQRYQPGDDLRYIDWNLYARMDKLLIKLFQDESNLIIYILVDKSKSMDYGQPNKFEYALKVAAALAYIGIINMEQVGVYAFSSEIEQMVRPHRGKGQVIYLLDFMDNIKPGGQTSLNSSLNMFATMARQPGIAIIISDFWDREDYHAGLQCILQRKFDVSLIQVTSQAELNPQVLGPVNIRDIESSYAMANPLTLNLSEGAIRRYHQLVQEHNQELAKFCGSYGISYIQTTTDKPFEELILKYMQLRESQG